MQNDAVRDNGGDSVPTNPANICEYAKRRGLNVVLVDDREAFQPYVEGRCVIGSTRPAQASWDTTSRRRR